MNQVGWCILTVLALGVWKEAGGSEVHGHPWLNSEFVASLGYVRLCLKKKNRSVYSIFMTPDFCWHVFCVYDVYACIHVGM